MGRLKTLTQGLRSMPSRLSSQTTRDVRTTGRKLQAIRFAIWRKDQHCKHCGEITAHPYGYEIDHVVALEDGGRDVDSNRQLLCIGCHDAKTRGEEAK